MAPIPTRIGPYEVVRLLGRGGMGAVFEVRDPDLPRTVALKQILNAPTPTALERFFREAEVLARVRHAGVVRVHALERDPPGPYLVLDLVAGETLGERLRRGPLPVREALTLTRDLALAVEAVHQAGVLHRDLKPDNVVVSESGQPVLLDFGVARDLRAETLTKTGQLVGTPDYMSPEQASGEGPSSFGPGIDVYALGALLYTLVCGHAPFERAGSAVNVFFQILHKDAPRLSTQGVAVPAGLDEVVERALQKDPDDRFPTAQAFAEALTQVLSGQRKGSSALAGDPRSALKFAIGVVLLGIVVVASLLVADRLTPAQESQASPAARPTARRTRLGVLATPLWRVQPGQDLRLRVSYDEDGQPGRIYLRVDLAVSARAAPPAVAAQTPPAIDLDLVVRRVRAYLKLRNEGTELPPSDYDTEASDPAALLSAFDQTVGKVIVLRLDRMDGHVISVQGAEELGAGVLKEIGERPVDKELAGMRDSLVQVLRKAFKNTFLASAIDGVLNVRGPKARLAWRGPRATKEGAEYRFLGRQQPMLHHPASHLYQKLATDRFAIEAKTLYDPVAGLLRRGRVIQTLQKDNSLPGKQALLRQNKAILECELLESSPPGARNPR